MQRVAEITRLLGLAKAARRDAIISRLVSVSDAALDKTLEEIGDQLSITDLANAIASRHRESCLWRLPKWPYISGIIKKKRGG